MALLFFLGDSATVTRQHQYLIDSWQLAHADSEWLSERVNPAYNSIHLLFAMRKFEDGVGMQKCAALAAGLALFSTGCHLKTKDLLKALDVSKAANINLTVSPSSPSLPVHGTQQFTAVVTGTADTQIDWRLGGPLCSGGQDCGSISDKGFYIAPGAIPNPNSITITASARGDAAGIAHVTITPAVEAQNSLRGTYTFLLTGSDAEGALSVAGKFVADGAGQLHSGEISFCRGQAPCAKVAFAGRYTSSTKDQGSFSADVLSGANFRYAFMERDVVHLQLDGGQGLHAIGIMESAKDTSSE
jgi:hypothetical protein